MEGVLCVFGQVALGVQVSRPSSSVAAVRRNRQGGAASEAPHETLMPGHRTAISWHLEPKPRPQSPAAVRLSGWSGCPYRQCQFLTLKVNPNGLTHQTGVPSHHTRSSGLTLGSLGSKSLFCPPLGFPTKASCPGLSAMGNTREQSAACETQSPSDLLIFQWPPVRDRPAEPG